MLFLFRYRCASKWDRGLYTIGFDAAIYCYADERHIMLGPHYHNEPTFKISSRKVYVHIMFEVATEVLMVENGNCSVKCINFFFPKNGLYTSINVRIGCYVKFIAIHAC